MGKATEGQARSLIASFAVDTPWSEINSDLQPFIELPPKERGERFAAFLKNNAKVIEGPSLIQIDRSQPFNPSFVGKDWTIWKGPVDGNGLEGVEDQDERSLALTELDLTKVQFETTLKKGEDCVEGEQKHKRLKEMGHIRLDAKMFRTLWDNKTLILESWKEKVNGYTRYIFFDGTVLRRPGGDRYVLCLYWRDGGWGWDYDWLDGDFGICSPSAVLAS